MESRRNRRPRPASWCPTTFSKFLDGSQPHLASDPAGLPPPLASPRVTPVRSCSIEPDTLPLNHSPSIRYTQRPLPFDKNPKFTSELSLALQQRRFSGHSFDFSEETSDTESASTKELIEKQSQSFIDEGLADFQAQIHQLQEEQERVQKKTFLNWINAHLMMHEPPLKIFNLIDDLKDGTKLLALLQVLSGEKLVVEKGRLLKRPHFLSNANTALQFLQNKKIKLVNINSTDVVDGRPSIVLGLIWTIILYFQIEENTKLIKKLGHIMEEHSGYGSTRSESPAASYQGSFSNTAISRDRVSVTRRSAAAETWKMGAKKTLLEWVRHCTTKKYGVEVNDFGPSWRDGNVFLFLMHSICPSIVDLQKCSNYSNKARLEYAFSLAESELGISSLLDPEDVDVRKPDEKSIMTYVAQFLNKFPEPGRSVVPNSKVRRRSMEPLEKTNSFDLEYGELLTWLNHTMRWISSLHEITKAENINFDYLKTLKNEYAGKERVFSQLKVLVETKNGKTSSSQQWQEVEELWKIVSTELCNWNWLEVPVLPSPIGPIAQWVSEAEHILGAEEKLYGKPDELVNQLTKKLEHHNAYFSKIPVMVTAFENAQKVPNVKKISPQILDCISFRLRTIAIRAAKRKMKLQFLEHKYCLISFLILVEAKLKNWAVKCGTEEEVQNTLDDYQNFVAIRNPFKEFERAFKEIRTAIDNRTSDSDDTDSESIMKFLYETEERWKNVSVELRCIQSLLEEVLSYWRTFRETQTELTNWLETAERYEFCSGEEEFEFLKSISAWKSKLAKMNENGNFLIATCRPDVGQYINTILADINESFNQILKYEEQSMEKDALFSAHLTAIDDWSKRVEDDLLLCQGLPIYEVNNFLEKLQAISTQAEEQEKVLKNLSNELTKTTSNHSNYATKVRQLSQQKEKLLLLRSQLSKKIHRAFQTKVQLEAIENGLHETENWLKDAETLISKTSPTDTCLVLTENLETFKSFFFQKSYIKSSLESKKRILTTLESFSKESENFNFSSMCSHLDNLYERMASVTEKSDQLEGDMLKCLRLLNISKACEEELTEWLHKADEVFKTKNVTSQQGLDELKNFLIDAPSSLVQQMSCVTQQLTTILEDDTACEALTASTANIQTKWNDIMAKTPLHFLRMDYRLAENMLMTRLNEIQQQLASEKKAFNRNENTQNILIEHENYFSTDLFDEVSSLLDQMMKIKEHYEMKSTDDNTFAESFAGYLQNWDEKKLSIDTIGSQLRQIPKQWEEYDLKIDDMVLWMEAVDEALLEVNREELTAEEYQRFSDKFEILCDGLDDRREDAEWLVLSMDLLQSHASDKDSLYEQTRLETLITRFKSSAKELEDSIEKVKLVNKAKRVKEDTLQLIDLLEEIKTDSRKALTPETLELDEIVDEQKNAVEKLNGMKKDVYAGSQRQKELLKQKETSIILKNTLESFEKKWNEIYVGSSQLLASLVGLQKEVTCFGSLREKLLQFLGRINNELSDDVNLELNCNLTAKIEIKKKYINEIESMVDQLKCSLLTSTKLIENINEKHQTSLAVEEKLNSDYRDAEGKAQHGIQSLDSSVKDIEEIFTEFDALSREINDIADWQESAEITLDKIINSSLNPEEKCQRMQQFKNILEEKVNLMENLKMQPKLKKIIEMCPQESSFRLKFQEVFDTMSIMESVTISKVNEMKLDGEKWQQYQAIIQTVDDSLCSLENEIPSVMIKPSSLDEAKAMLNKLKEFASEGSEISHQINNMEPYTEGIKSYPGTGEQRDFIGFKWAQINDSIVQRCKEMSYLIDNFESFSQTHCQVISTFERIVELFAFCSNKSYREEISMERYWEITVQLEKYFTSISGSLEEMSNIDGRCNELANDTFSYQNRETVANLYEDLNFQKQKLDIHKQNYDIAKEHVNQIEIKLSRNAKWLDVIESNLKNNSDVFDNKILSVREKIQKMLTDLKVNLVKFDNSYTTIVREDSTANNFTDLQLLLTNCDSLRERFQYLENKLSSMVETLTQWDEFVLWLADIKENIFITSDKIDNCDDFDETSKLIDEISEVQNNILSWEEKIVLIRNSSLNATLMIKNHTTKNNIDVVSEFEALTTQAEDLACKTKQKTAILKQNQDTRTNVQLGKDKVLSSLGKIEDQLSVTADIHYANFEDIKKAKIDIKNLVRDIEDISNTQKVFTEKCQIAIGLDPQNSDKFNGDLQEVESTFCLIYKKLTKYQEDIDQLLILTEEFMKYEEDVENILSETEERMDCAAKEKNADERKKLYKTIDASITPDLFDQYFCQANKVSLFGMTRIEVIEQKMESTKSRLSIIRNEISSRLQATETEVALNEIIDCNHRSLTEWLCSFQNKLSECYIVEEHERQVTMFRTDFPVYQSKYENLKNKMTDLNHITTCSEESHKLLLETLENDFQVTSSLVEDIESQISSYKENHRNIQAKYACIKNKINEFNLHILQIENLIEFDSSTLSEINRIQFAIDTEKEKFRQLQKKVENLGTTYKKFDLKELSEELDAGKGLVADVSLKIQTLVSSTQNKIQKLYDNNRDALFKDIRKYQNKISKCQKQPNNDRYAVETKLSTLEEMKQNLKLSRKKVNNLEMSTELYSIIFEDAIDESLLFDRESLIEEFEELYIIIEELKENQGKTLVIWTDYDELNETLNNWLRDVESKCKGCQESPVDRNQIRLQIKAIESILEDIKSHENEAVQIMDLSSEILKMTSDTRIEDTASYLVDRVQNLIKTSRKMLNKLHRIHALNETYKKSVNEMYTYIQESKEKLEYYSDLFQNLSLHDDGFHTEMDEYKQYFRQLEDVQPLFTSLKTYGKTLADELPNTNNQIIHDELKIIQSEWDLHFTENKALYRKLQDKANFFVSLNESLADASMFLSGSRSQIEGITMGKTDFSVIVERKNSVINLLSRLEVHQQVMDALHENVQIVGDPATLEEYEKLYDEYNSLINQCKKMEGQYQKDMESHKNITKSIEMFQVWIDDQQSTYKIHGFDDVDLDNIELLKSKCNSHIENLKSGESLIRDIKQFYNDGFLTILDNEVSSINKQVENCERQFEEYCSCLFENKKEFEIATNFLQSNEDLINAINDWCTVNEEKIVDDSLRKNLDDKRSFCKWLEDCKLQVEDFSSKTSIIATSFVKTSNMQKWSALNKLSIRLKQLGETVNGRITAYENFIEDHRNFLEKYEECDTWLNALWNEVTDISQKAADMKSLQAKQAEMQKFATIKDKNAYTIEKVFELGHQVLPNTSVEGRESVLYSLRVLRDNWNSWISKINNFSKSIDRCLLQFSEFSDAQEQLTEWLKSVEQTMKQHKEMKNTVAEKIAQLQNHTITHEEILSRKQLVSTVCEKARSLVDETEDKSLCTFVESIEILFKNIVLKSEDLIFKLQLAVEDHQNLENENFELGSYLEKDKLEVQKWKTDTLDKSEIENGLQFLKNHYQQMKSQKPKLEQFVILSKKVQSQSSETGQQVLQTQEENVIKNWEQNANLLENKIKVLEDTLSGWNQSSHLIESAEKWFEEKISFCSRFLTPETVNLNMDDLEYLLQVENEIFSYKKRLEEIAEIVHSSNSTGCLQDLTPRFANLTRKYVELQNGVKKTICRLNTTKKKYEQTCAIVGKISTILDGLQDEINKNSSEDIYESDFNFQFFRDSDDKVSMLLTQVKEESGELLSNLDTQTKNDIETKVDHIHQRRNSIVKKYQHLINTKEQYMNKQKSLQESVSSALDWITSLLPLDFHVNELADQSEEEAYGNYLSLLKKYMKELGSNKSMFENIRENAAAVLHLNPDSTEVLELTNVVDDARESAYNTIKEAHDETEIIMVKLSTYSELHQSIVENLKEANLEFVALQDVSGTSGDILNRQEKLKHVKDKSIKLSPLISELVTYSKEFTEILNYPFKSKTKSQVDYIKRKFEDLDAATSKCDNELTEQLQLWRNFENENERISLALSELENNVKKVDLCSDLDEKVAQAENVQNLSDWIDQVRKDVGLLNEASQFLMANGDGRIRRNFEQTIVRATVTQNAIKEMLARCKDSVELHSDFLYKYDNISDWLSAAKSKYMYYDSTESDPECMQKNLTFLNSLLEEKKSAGVFMEEAIHAASKLQTTTNITGFEQISKNTELLHSEFNLFFKSLMESQQDLKNQISIWDNYNDDCIKLKVWLQESERQVPLRKEVKGTLDEKREVLEIYRTLHSENSSKLHEIDHLKQLAESMPDNAKNQVDDITSRYNTLHERIQTRLKDYEKIVNDHEQYIKIVFDLSEWMEGSQTTIDMWKRNCDEGANIRATIEKLKSVNLSLPEQEQKLAALVALSEKVLSDTDETGSHSIRSQVDATQQDWECLHAEVSESINSLQQTLAQLTEVESLKESFNVWLQQKEVSLDALCLVSTSAQKQDQLVKIKLAQSEIKSKHLEMDKLINKQKSLPILQTELSPTVTDLKQKYDRIYLKAQDLIDEAKKVLSDHIEFDSKITDLHKWMQSMKDELLHCDDIPILNYKEIKKLDEKITALMNHKVEGYKKVEFASQIAQVVLASTSPDGHQCIHNEIEHIQEEWSQLVSEMADLKAKMDENSEKLLHFIDILSHVEEVVDTVESSLSELCQSQASVSEKKKQLEQIKSIEERLKCEVHETDLLVAKTHDINLNQCRSLAERLSHNTKKKIENLLQSVESQKKQKELELQNHISYNKTYEDFSTFMERIREKLSSACQRTLADRLAVETVTKTIETLLTDKIKGQIIIDELVNKGEIVRRTASAVHHESIRKQLDESEASLHNVFETISKKKGELDQICVCWKKYQDEYEKILEWISHGETEIVKCTGKVYATVNDKSSDLQQIKEMYDNLLEEEPQLNKLSNIYKELSQFNPSPLIESQMKQLRTRYDSQLTSLKETMDKTEQSLDAHLHFELEIEETKQQIATCKGNLIEIEENINDGCLSVEDQLKAVDGVLQQLEKIQVAINKLSSSADSIKKDSNQPTRENIDQLTEILQNDLDDLSKAASEIKSNLEHRAIDVNNVTASYSSVQQWIADREIKLEELSIKTSVKNNTSSNNCSTSLSIGERKANLRKTNAIIYELASYKPIIDSVTSKSTDDAQDLEYSAELSVISSKYDSLNEQAKKLLESQKDMVHHHQNFVDAGNDFMIWLQDAKDRMEKCSEPIGDKEVISGKATVIKLLQNEQDLGQTKLDNAFNLAELACELADDEDRDVIEEEMAFLQNEFDSFLIQVGRNKNQLEIGIVKWTEYEDNFKECEKWLDHMEAQVKEYKEKCATLSDKKTLYIKFKKIQNQIKNWHQTLDLLNMRAQNLLSTCADSRISNEVTQLTTSYKTLASTAKEIMKNVESSYHDHHQLSKRYKELKEWVSISEDKLSKAKTESTTLSEIQEKLDLVKIVKKSLDSGHEMIRAVVELFDKVMKTTSSDGCDQLKNDKDSVAHSFDQLVKNIYDMQQDFGMAVSRGQAEEKMLSTIEDQVAQLKSQLEQPQSFIIELSEKRAHIQRLKIISNDMETYYNLMEKLKSKVDGSLSDSLSELENKFEELREMHSEKLEVLNENIEIHEDYVNAYEDAQSWMKATRLEIIENSDTRCDKTLLQVRRETQEELFDNLPYGEEKLKSVIDFKSRLFEIMPPVGQTRLVNEMEKLKREWDSLRSLSGDALKRLAKCLKAWSEFEEELDFCQHWLKEFQVKLEKLPTDPSLEHLQTAEDILHELLLKKSQMDVMVQKCDILMTYNTVCEARHTVETIQASYSKIMSQTQETVLIAQKSLESQTTFVNAKKEFQQWLIISSEVISNSEIDYFSENEVMSQMKSLEEIYGRLAEGERLLTALQDAYSKLEDSNIDENNETPRINITSQINEWEHFNDKLNESLKCLQNKVIHWKNIESEKSKIVKYLEKIQETQNDHNPETVDVLNLQSEMMICKSTQEDIGDVQERLNNYKSLWESVSTRGGSEEISSIEYFHEQINKFESANVTMMEKLENEVQMLQEYPESLQNSEKWLLEVSFHLMGDNNFTTCSREELEAKLASYENEMAMIEEYRPTIENLRKKAYLHINKYETSDGSLQNTIEQQLENIQKSYESLLEANKSMFKQTEDALKSFRDQDITYNSIIQKVEQWQQDLLEESFQNLDNLDDMKEGLHTLQAWLNDVGNELTRVQSLSSLRKEREAILFDSSQEENIGDANAIRDQEILIQGQLEEIYNKVQREKEDLKHKISNLQEINAARESITLWVVDTTKLINERSSSPSIILKTDMVKETEFLSNLQDQLQEKINELDDLEVKGYTMFEEFRINDLRQEMDNLENILHEFVAEKSIVQNEVENYQTSLAKLYEYFEIVLKQLEKCEVAVQNIDIHTYEIANNLFQTYDLAAKELENIKNLAESISLNTRKVDAQQLMEEITSTERKFENLSKRVLKRKQLLENVRFKYESAISDLEHVKTWVSTKLEEISIFDQSTSSLENLLATIQDWSNKCSAKKTDVSDLKLKIEMHEKQFFSSEEYNNIFYDIESSFGELMVKIDEKRDELEDLLSKKNSLEKLSKDVSSTMNDYEEKVACPYYLPLKSLECEKVEDKLLSIDLKEKIGNRIDLIKKDISIMERSNLPIDVSDWNKLLETLLFRYNMLCNRLVQSHSLIKEMVDMRKDFEGEINKCDDFIEQAKLVVQMDITTINSAEGLNAHLMQLRKLDEDEHGIRKQSQSITNMCVDLLDSLSEKDKINLGEVVRNCQESIQSLFTSIEDKIISTEFSITQILKKRNQIEETKETLRVIDKKLDIFSHPKGSSTDKVNELLQICGDMLKQVVSLKNSISENSVDLPSNELEIFNSQIEILMMALRNHKEELKQKLEIRQKFQELLSELVYYVDISKTFIEENEQWDEDPKKRVIKYEQALQNLPHYEMLLTTMQEYGATICEDCAVEDHNHIIQNVVSLKTSINEFRNYLEIECQKIKIESRDLGEIQSTIVKMLDWFLENESELKSHPVLTLDTQSAKNEMEHHKSFAQSVLDKLDELNELIQYIEDNDSMIGLTGNLSEAKALISVFPTELEKRQKHLHEAINNREQYDCLTSTICDWVTSANRRLTDSSNVSLNNIKSLLDDHISYFASQSHIGESLGHLTRTAEAIVFSLSQEDQENMSKGLKSITQQLDKVTTDARQRQIYLEDFSKALHFYENEKIKFKSQLDIPRTLASSASKQSQKYVPCKMFHSGGIQQLADKSKLNENLKTAAQALMYLVSESDKVLIEDEVVSLLNELKTVTEEYDQTMRHQTSLVQKQNYVDQEIHNLENQLNEVNHRLTVFDDTSSSMNLTEEHILKMQEEAEDILLKIESAENHLQEYCNFIGNDDSSVQLVLHSKIEAIRSSQKKITAHLDMKRTWVEGEASFMELIETQIGNLNGRLESKQSRLNSLHVHECMDSTVKQWLHDFDREVAEDLSEVVTFITNTQQHYASQKLLLPEQIVDKFMHLSTLAENLRSSCRKILNKSDRITKINSQLQTIENLLKQWIEDVRNHLEDTTSEPSYLKGKLQDIFCETYTINKKVERLNELVNETEEFYRDQEDFENKKHSIFNLSNEVSEMIQLVECRKTEIGESLDGWQIYIEMHASLEAWLEKQRLFLAEQLNFATLSEAKKKLMEYTKYVRECKRFNKQLADMKTELNMISQVSNITILASKQTNIEFEKLECEKSLKELQALLIEMTEEWEQWERKSKEAQIWISKTNQSLFGNVHKKQSPREELVTREKELNDITIHKTKLSIAMEKLLVHFKNRMSADSQIFQENQTLQNQLSTLQMTLKQRCTSLESRVQQIETLQQEIQKLRLEVRSAEMQLRLSNKTATHSFKPTTYSPDGDECREKVRILKTKINAKNERVKLLCLDIDPDASRNQTCDKLPCN